MRLRRAFAGYMEGLVSGTVVLHERTQLERRAPGRAPTIALILVMLVFVVLATAIAIRTPAWESSDEAGHVQNVETLVGGNWYRMDQGSGNEAHQPPLYYLGLAEWQRLVGPPQHVVEPGPGGLAGPRGVYFHHTAADHRFLLWLRLPNVVLGALTLLLTARAARMVSANPWTPVVAAAVIGMTPRFLFLSAFVTNDNLATLLAALVTLLALRFVASPSMGRIALLGGALGLLITTKLSALPLVAVLAVALFVPRTWVARVRLALVGAAVALGVSSWYLIQNYVRYGDPLARTASERYLGPIGGLGSLSPSALAGDYTVNDPLRLVTWDVPTKIFRHYWYTSGWNQFSWPLWPTILLWGLLAIALVGLLYARVRPLTLITLGVLAAAGFASVWLVAFETASYEPRLAFTGLPALACLAAVGTERFRPAVRFLLPAAGLIGVLVAMHNDVFTVHWY